MAEQTQLQGLVEQLNNALGEITPYKLAVVPPGEVKPVEKNAHYMPKRVYDQFKANIERDGNLSSLPFCWRKPNGELVALSGNHRRMIAEDAGVPLIMVLYTDEKLNRSQQVAIQLSHNALVGQDNPTTLRELWQEIDDLNYKVYSGLDEEHLETMESVNVARIQEQALKFEELTILFLSPEIDRIEDVLQRLGSANKRRLAAKYSEFDRFFECLLAFKEAEGIVSTPTAIMAMIEIIENWLAEHVQGENEQEK